MQSGVQMSTAFAPSHVCHRWVSSEGKLTSDFGSCVANSVLWPCVEWPLGRQSNWLDWVNQAEMEHELESLRKSVQRGRPFGCVDWLCRMAERDRQTARTRIGISARRSPTKTRATPSRWQSKTIRCRNQVHPLYQYRTCPVFFLLSVNQGRIVGRSARRFKDVDGGST
jgi:hypothetical protein